ncbi:MAG: hypothetical protein AAGI37_19175 [Planctomycetota bacterium]
MASPQSNQPNDDSEAISVLELLAHIKDGRMPTLSKEQRQACVMHLCAEDYRLAEIAKILSVSDRTIYRDRVEIRKRNSLKSDSELAQQLAGDLLWRADADAAKLKAIARDPQAPHAAQIQAIEASFNLREKAIARAQSLGCLPVATQRVSAELQHGFTELPSNEELERQARALFEIAQASGDQTLVDETKEISGLLKLDHLQRDVEDFDASSTD